MVAVPSSLDLTARPVNEDDELMLRLQGGDESAFEELVQRHHSNLLGFFIKNLRDRQLAEDLTQDTLIRLYERFWDYLPRGRFGGWLFRIARNLMIDHVRRKRSDALVRSVTASNTADEDDILSRLAGEFDAPADVAGRNEFARLVESLLDQIPEDQRLTFTMHHFAGLSLPEVADAMETNTATAKSRLRLAREKLQALLKPEQL